MVQKSASASSRGDNLEQQAAESDAQSSHLISIEGKILVARVRALEQDASRRDRLLANYELAHEMSPGV